MVTSQQYVFKVVTVHKVTDGDTYWLRCDVGFRQEALVNIRLHGYDCPERHRGSDYEKAKAVEAARAAALFLMDPDGQLWVQTKPDPDNFGRWLGDVWAESSNGSQLHLGDHLRALGLASVWPVRWREVYDQTKETA